MADPAAWLAMVTSGWSEIGQTAFWVSLLQIMWINILLSGDNAVVIAMACRGLRPRQRLWGMILGAGAALLGWIVGEVIATDPGIERYLELRLGAEGFHYVVLFAALLGAILVLIVGALWRRSKQTEPVQKPGAAE